MFAFLISHFPTPPADREGLQQDLLGSALQVPGDCPRCGPGEVSNPKLLNRDRGPQSLGIQDDDQVRRRGSLPSGHERNHGRLNSRGEMHVMKVKHRQFVALVVSFTNVSYRIRSGDL